MSLKATRAILRSEGTTLYSSWLLRGWLLLVVALALLTLAAVGEAQSVPRALAGWLAIYALPSAIMAGVLGTAALSSELDVAADSVLSRGVTRTDFVVGKVSARLALILGGHLIVTLPTMYVAQKLGPADGADALQIAVGSLAVGLTLLFLSSLGSLLGALFRSALVAVAALMIAFASQSLIFDFVGLEYLSPSALLQDMESWLDGRGDAWEQVRYFLAFSAGTAACLAATLASFYRRDL